MYLFRDIVTKDTPILTFPNKVSKEDRYKVEELASLEGIKFFHIEKIHILDGKYYFLKLDEPDRPLYEIMNELIGSYLCKEVNLDALKYFIGKKGTKLGVASLDFKDLSKYDYYHPLKEDTLEKTLDRCISPCNKEIFLLNFYKLLSIDYMMAQSDRARRNIEIKEDLDTHEISFAPIYDFSLCNAHAGKVVNHFFAREREEDFLPYLKNNPMLKDVLEEVMDIDITRVIYNIFSDYSFNKEGSSFSKTLDHYENLFEKRKSLIFK